MWIFKSIVKLVKLLNSETSATSLGLAFSLGMFLGFVPLLTLQGLAVLAVVLFFRVNLSGTILFFFPFWAASKALQGPFDSIGVSLLESPALLGLWTFLYNAPGLSLMGTNHSVTLGATLVATALVGPFFMASRALVRAYRGKVSERWAKLGAANALRGSWVYRIYSWIDSPFH